MTNAQRFRNTSKATMISEAKRNQRRAAECAREARDTGSAFAAQEAKFYGQIARELLFAIVSPAARYIPLAASA